MARKALGKHSSRGQDVPSHQKMAGLSPATAEGSPADAEACAKIS